MTVVKISAGDGCDMGVKTMLWYICSPGTQPSTLARSVGEEEEKEGAMASRGFHVLAVSVSRAKSSCFGCVCASLCRTLLDIWLDTFLNRSNLKCRVTNFCPDLWLGPMKGQGIRFLREHVGDAITRLASLSRHTGRQPRETGRSVWELPWECPGVGSQSSRALLFFWVTACVCCREVDPFVLPHPACPTQLQETAAKGVPKAMIWGQKPPDPHLTLARALQALTHAGRSQGMIIVGWGLAV